MQRLCFARTTKRPTNKRCQQHLSSLRWFKWFERKKPEFYISMWVELAEWRSPENHIFVEMFKFCHFRPLQKIDANLLEEEEDFFKITKRLNSLLLLSSYFGLVLLLHFTFEVSRINLNQDLVIKECRHSSVDLSAPTILPPRVRVPSTQSTFFTVKYCHCVEKRTEINKKRGRVWPI